MKAQRNWDGEVATGPTSCANKRPSRKTGSDDVALGLGLRVLQALSMPPTRWDSGKVHMAAQPVCDRDARFQGCVPSKAWPGSSYLGGG